MWQWFQAGKKTGRVADIPPSSKLPWAREDRVCNLSSEEDWDSKSSWKDSQVQQKCNCSFPLGSTGLYVTKGERIKNRYNIFSLEKPFSNESIINDFKVSFLFSSFVHLINWWDAKIFFPSKQVLFSFYPAHQIPSSVSGSNSLCDIVLYDVLNPNFF